MLNVRQDPNTLSDLQKSRMVELRYVRAACFSMSFATIPPGATEPTGKAQRWGRNFLFAGGGGHSMA